MIRQERLENYQEGASDKLGCNRPPCVVFLGVSGEGTLCEEPLVRVRERTGGESGV